ncbi:MAG: hypothetical protein AAFO06_23670 [Cyanobacteria bacterium J06597_16]
MKLFRSKQNLQSGHPGRYPFQILSILPLLSSLVWVASDFLQAQIALAREAGNMRAFSPLAFGPLEALGWRW